MSNKSKTEIQAELSQLRWHCRRGVKELDVVLSKYLENHYLDSSAELQEAYKVILKLEDPILLSLIMDQQHLDDDMQNQVLEKLKQPYS